MNIRAWIMLAIALLLTTAVAAQSPPPDLPKPPAVGTVVHRGPDVRALLVPLHEATLSAGITGLITDMPFRPGQTFAKGDRLVAFDCRSYQAALAAARATTQGAQASLRSVRQRFELNSAGALEVELAKVEVAKAEAELKARSVDVDRCTVEAPWPGRVAEWHAHPHETIKAGDQVLGVLSDRALEIEVIVPSGWLAWLHPGAPFQVHLDETGQTYDATVGRLGARVDPASQSVLVVGTFASPPSDALAGMSGEARFPNQP